MKQVAAAIMVDGSRVFIAKRSSTDALPGKWEFPGGKVEERESPQECLKREMKEEFDIEVAVGDYLGSSFFEYKGVKMELLGYLTKWSAGEIRLKVHDDAKWVDLNELGEYDFASADIPLVEKLQKFFQN